jgi:hypothetical protein
MISEQSKGVLGQLLDAYNALPWYKKLFYPGALSVALKQYDKEAPSLETASAIYNAYVNKTWFFQRWFFSSLVSFSGSSLGAELRTLNEKRPLTSDELPDEEQPVIPNRLGKLPMELVNMVASHLTNQDVREWAMSSRQAYSIFPAPNILGKFLECIAYGQQDKAERLLSNVFNGQQEKIQQVLRYQGKFTDYSGRTFNCTAYEYAYWAKDTHMCRMLERHMDDETKAYMLARIDEIERIDEATGQPIGLVYSQAGQEHRSAHFGFTPLKEAYQHLAGYDEWSAAQAFQAAWMEVGIAQRDMPVHVVNEYCHPVRSFAPRPEFNEEALPRSLIFYNYNTNSEQDLFPLDVSDTTGLGIDFALRRGWCICGPRGAFSGGWGEAGVDLAAVSRLDEVRTVDLTQSRENLQPTDPEASHSMGVQ